MLKRMLKKILKSNNKAKCDVCGNIADRFEHDVVEIQPTRDKNGQLWANWKYYGKRRYGCGLHIPRIHRIYRLEDIDYPQDC